MQLAAEQQQEMRLQLVETQLASLSANGDSDCLECGGKGCTACDCLDCGVRNRPGFYVGGEAVLIRPRVEGSTAFSFSNAGGPNKTTGDLGLEGFFGTIGFTR